MLYFFLISNEPEGLWMNEAEAGCLSLSEQDGEESW